MIKPNFLIIGAAKAGTTSLYHYLAQHPDIFMSPVKEPRFFAYEGQSLNFQGAGMPPPINTRTITDWEAYLNLFRKAGGKKAIGEASPIYMNSSKAPERIRHYIPDAKLIAVLRNPIERAFSTYLFMVLEGLEPAASFEDAIDAEGQRIRENWAPIYHYRDRGFYYRDLMPYYRLFKKEQLRIYLYEDLKTSPLSVTRDIFEFLGVDTGFTPEISRRYNASGVPKNKMLHSAIMTVRRKTVRIKSALKQILPEILFRRLSSTVDYLYNSNLGRPALLPETRQKLAVAYRQDILNLQEMLGRDLSEWLR